MATGYVYILLNPAMPDYLKIGRTNRTSEDRAAELSATTGIPTRFHVAYDVLVGDSEAVETIIHQRLSSRRASDDREFFCVSLKEAISTLAEVALSFPVPDDEADIQSTADEEEVSKSDIGPWQTVHNDELRLVKSQIDSSSNNIRYSIRLYPPNRNKSLAGYRYSESLTKWVSSGVSFDAALSESLAASGTSHGRLVRWDGFYGESGTYVELADGSTRGHGYEPNHLIREWTSVANVTRMCNWGAALAIAEQIVAEYPAESLGYRYKARALHKLKRTAEAKAYLRAQMDRFPDDHELIIDLSCYDCILSSLNESKARIKHAKSIMPKSKIRSTVNDRNNRYWGFFAGELNELERYVNRWIWL